ncbi:phosphoribosylglycinamide formyltransferase [candidate division WOR-3 bacterium]|uniref:Phosphoribosylglycinamide formyltransferase n=1 Tax=candidate division WOR-3 bacterium TaxID=2052148 RepID=A0A938BTC6_UNCW3|nr:phosphoribosylglycinamide formyltransferase [candidate division WOR-3 bacterium]
MSSVNIAVLASGRGTNFEALVHATRRPNTHGEVRLLVTNIPDAPVLKKAELEHVPAMLIPHRGFKTRAEFEQALVAELNRHDIGLVCLAGFMRILSPVFVNAFADRIMNIHPSLLPAFAGLQGMQVHAAVMAAGVKVTGCTVHFVNTDVDAGPIIVQRAIAVRDVDTPESLALRVLVEEHLAYAEAVKLFCTGRLKVEGRRVRVLGDDAGRAVDEGTTHA